MSKEAVLIVDGNNIAWRAAAVIERDRFKDEGDHLSLGLLDVMLNKRMREMQERDGYSVVVPMVAFDAGKQDINNDAKINRFTYYQQYKANRKDTGEDPEKTEFNALREQWKDRWRDQLLDQGIAVVEHPCVEGDDILSYGSHLIAHRTDANVDVALWTVDKDLMQCVNDDESHRVIMYRKRFSKDPVTGRKTSEERMVNGTEVMNEKGVPPEKVRMQLALAGDSADDYKGVKGYGGVRGVKLVNVSQNIDDLRARLCADLQAKKTPPSDDELASYVSDLDRNWTLAGCGRDWMPTSAITGVELGVHHVLNQL
jgi:5'-3' exonuclease